MNQETHHKLLQEPLFKELAKKKGIWSTISTVATFVAYFAFIGAIAWAPDFMGSPMIEGAYATIGLTMGLAVIIFAIALTGIYVWKANGEFEVLTQKIVRIAEGEKEEAGHNNNKGDNT